MPTVLTMSPAAINPIPECTVLIGVTTPHAIVSPPLTLSVWPVT